MLPVVLLSSATPESAADLRELLAGAGFSVRTHALGSAAGVDFGSVVAAVVEVGAQASAAAAQTRRWRAELSDDLLPILWFVSAANPELGVLGFDSGADAVIPRPLDPDLFAAQFRAAARSRAAAARVAARANETRLLADQLTRLRDQLEREHAAARRIQLAFRHRALPQTDNVGLHVAHRARGKTGGDHHAVQVIGQRRVAFLVGDVTGSGTAASLLGTLLASTLTAFDANDPGRFLSEVNRVVLHLDLEEAPLVAVCAGVIDTHTGELKLARAGLPPPIHMPSHGEPRALAVPGPFLGTAETLYPTHAARLHPGDRLLVSTDGLRPDGKPGPGDDAALLAVATHHRELAGQRFVDAVVAQVMAEVLHEEDITLLAIEFAREKETA
jgi:phosphoserine phosphatase RsbU/P